MSGNLRYFINDNDLHLRNGPLDLSSEFLYVLLRLCFAEVWVVLMFCFHVHLSVVRGGISLQTTQNGHINFVFHH